MEPSAIDESGVDREENVIRQPSATLNIRHPRGQLALDLNAEDVANQPSHRLDSGGEPGSSFGGESEPEDALDWSEVKRLAELAFNIWMGQPELGWAKKAFDALLAGGLVNVMDAFSRQRAICRVLVLGGLYRDFCDVAWEETSWIDYQEWCEPEELADRLIVGQLFARMPDWDEDEGIDFAVALDRLVEAERDAVVETLKNAFSGVAGLYASLWQSRQSDDEDDELEDECFEPDDVGKLKSYEWVSNGCPRIADINE